MTLLSTKFQKGKKDKAYQKIDNIISKLKDFTDNVDIYFNFAVKLGEKENTIPSPPTLAKSSRRFRPNVENDGSLSSYKRSIVIPFLDDIKC